MKNGETAHSLDGGVDLFTAPTGTHVNRGGSYYIDVCLYSGLISKTSQRTINFLYHTKQTTTRTKTTRCTYASEIDACAIDRKIYRKDTVPLIATVPTISFTKTSTKTTLAFSHTRAPNAAPYTNVDIHHVKRNVTHTDPWQTW